MTVAERSFRNRFGRSPDVIVSAPGRVNLIGEHTDYSLLPAMPLAIDRRVVVAAAADDRRFELHSGTYPDNPVIGAPGAEGWDRYIGAAV
ncbi:MAG: galactokinase family protein, partial [Candidatus Limnocylindria bacterium]